MYMCSYSQMLFKSTENLGNSWLLGISSHQSHHPIYFVSDLEWKIIYVGSAESEEFDQILDTVYVGPVPEGRHLFVFEVSVFYHIFTCLLISKLI